MKIEELQSGQRVRVTFKGNGENKGKTFNTPYISFNVVIGTTAHFDCDNGMDKYIIEVKNITQIRT
ncbi:MAG: hypothetical protein WC380_00095 [Pedobacter sp.]|jgi:hypothetical protein